MDNLKQVLDKANKAYDKHIKEEPLVYEERMRTAYLLGRLESSYERLYEQIKSKKS